MIQVEFTASELDEILQRQKNAYKQDPFMSKEVRVDNLHKLERILKLHQSEICQAIHEDFGARTVTETSLLEVFTSIESAVDARKNLSRWMKPKRRSTSIWFQPAKNSLIPQPLGSVGIMVPWNYPLMLAISPMVTAMAAGNRIMVKMSENSQRLCRVLANAFAQEFDQSEICFVAETGDTGPAFARLPFDHLIFTGSTATGKKVMAAAAENLTPVTLELGGKSPAIIAKDYPLKKALSRILGGKSYNSGQTCVAPDYLVIPEESLEQTIKLAKAIIAKRFAKKEVTELTSIIDEASYARLMSTLADAREKGAEVINLLSKSEPNDQTRQMAIHLVVNPTDDMTVLQREIFGPILPIVTYKSLDEVYQYVGERDRPLALYLFTNDKSVKKEVLHSTISGGVAINDVMVHVAQHDLPFGGVGASGIGNYHGRDGFESLSKMKPVMHQSSVAVSSLLLPPYSGFAKRMVNFLVNRKLHLPERSK